MTGKTGGEVVAVGKTVSECDCGNRMSGFAQFFCRLFQPDRIQVFYGAYSESRAEKSGQRGNGTVDSSGEILQFPRFRMVLFHEPEQTAEIADFRGTDFFFIGKTAADDNAEIQKQESVHAVPSRLFSGLFLQHPGEDLFALLKRFIGKSESVAEPEFFFESGVVFKKDIVSGGIGEIAVFVFPVVFMEQNIGDPEVSQIFIFMGTAERDQKCISLADRIGSVFGDVGPFSGTDDDNFIEFMMMPVVIESSAVVNRAAVHV